MMKKALTFLLCCLLLTSSALADGLLYPCSSSSSTTTKSCDIYGLATTRLATRTGPGTEYSEPGTFRVEGEYVKLISRAYDCNDVCWLQVELEIDGHKQRVYTGLKRFDQSTFDLYSLPVECESRRVKVLATMKLYMGPNCYDYASIKNVTVDRGMWVTVIDDGYEKDQNSDYALIEFTAKRSGIKYRGWVPWIQLDY